VNKKLNFEFKKLSNGEKSKLVLRRVEPKETVLSNLLSRILFFVVRSLFMGIAEKYCC
jgi:hypothetical protein